MTIFSTKDDTVETILEKINSGKDNGEKLLIYSMFVATHMATKARSLDAINVYIQLKDPELWKIIKKRF
jgi:hypothetical protein